MESNGKSRINQQLISVDRDTAVPAQHLGFWMILLWALPLWAQDGTIVSLHLKPEVQRYSGLRVNFDYRFHNALPRFAAEPDYGEREIARGLIPTLPPTGFIRNITDHELCLDLDHDGDFLATPPVTYQSTYDGHVVFQNLQVNTVRQDLTIPYTITLYTYEHVCSGWLIVCTVWSTDFEMAGRQWRLQVIDNLDGIIDSNDQFTLIERTSGGQDLLWANRCHVAEQIVLGGQLYDLTFQFQALKGDIVLGTSLEKMVGRNVGIIKTEVSGLESLSLRNERCLVLLDVHDANTIVPAGDYHLDSCVLIQDPNLDGVPKFVSDARIFSVRPGETTLLKAGTPLTNTIAVDRRRNCLRLTYGLQGIGGEEYSFYNWQDRASFDIYLGPFRIASRCFGFG